MFCRRNVADLRSQAERTPGFPPVVFAHTASEEQAEGFFRLAWPEVAAIADPGKDLYASFGLGHGRLAQLFGLPVWKAGLQAAARGHGIGLPQGDPRMMSGDFLVHEGVVAWSSIHPHAGSRSDFDEALRRARELAAG